MSACTQTSINNNINRKRSIERIIYENCKNKNFGDISKCDKEKTALFEREEIELMDEGS